MDIFEKCYSFTGAQDARESGYYPYFIPIEENWGSKVKMRGREVIMCGSNNYLGLAQDPRVQEAAQKAIEKYGTTCSGSRLINGTFALHEELEHQLALFVGRDAALCFTAGYLANLGSISALLGRRDHILSDRYNHASIVDGLRLGLGDVKKFKHSDVEDLDRTLESIRDKNKLVVVDGVFSMEGDITPLDGILALREKHDFGIMVDDAHGVGVLGATGRGTAEHFGQEEEVDVIMGTYSKSLATIGGFVAASADIIKYLKHTSRSMIFSASLAPGLVAAVSAALDIIDQEPERREQLWKNTRKMMDGFRSYGFDTGDAATPIIPVIVGDDMLTFKMALMLQEEGVFANPVVSPAVPPGRGLLRTSYMATHTDDQLDRVLEAFVKVGRGVGLIS